MMTILQISLSLSLFLLSASPVVGGSNNTVYGDGAGDAQYGDNNVNIGVNAHAAATSSSDMNVFIGVNAGLTDTNSQGQTFIGYNSGSSITTGYDNVFIGYRTGEAVTTGGDNTFIGDEAGVSCDTGHDNTFVGHQSGHECTDCDQNTFVGMQSGHQCTTCRRNTAVGRGAMHVADTSHHNTAFGHSALFDVTTGSGNSAFGAYAGIDLGPNDSSLGSASCNSMFGLSSGQNTENPSFNTFLGALSGCDNNRQADENGHANTYVGTAAGRGIRQGNYNTIVGSFSDAVAFTEDDAETWCAEPDNTGCPGSSTNTKMENMVALGSNIIVEADGVVALGAESSVSDENGIAIGYQASVTKENSVAIGSGTEVTQKDTIALGGDDSSGTSMRVGIGNTAPNSHASLDLGATDKGLLLNRLTTAERTTLGSSLSASETGMVVFDTDMNAPMVWNGGTLSWLDLSSLNTGIGTDSPNDNASLDLGAADKGLLLNRLTTDQRNTFGDTLSADEDGMVVYDTDESMMYIWNANRMWWDEYSPKKTYRYAMQASIEGLGATPAVYYGGAMASGLIAHEDATILSLSFVMDNALTSGTVTLDIAINGVLQNQELVLSSGGKSGIIDFSPSLQLLRGDLIEVSVSLNDSGSTGAEAGSVLLALEAEEDAPAPPTPQPSATPSSKPSSSPSITPSVAPSTVPSTAPSALPSIVPSITPSNSPTASKSPSSTPSSLPSVSPSIFPSQQPSATPTVSPPCLPNRAMVDYALNNIDEVIDEYGDISKWCFEEMSFESLLSAQTNASMASFNEDISGWDVSRVTNMFEMFKWATSFNQPLGSWDVSAVTDMTRVFRTSSSFNQDISSWNVSQVTNMKSMFAGAADFNQDISSWDVSSVREVQRMFQDSTAFNQDLSSWDMSSVTDARYMFRRSSSFNKDLCAWSTVLNSTALVTDMFDGAACPASDITPLQVNLEWESLCHVCNPCSTGILSGDVCCASTCGTCGGADCHTFPGGSSGCCTGTITGSGTVCGSWDHEACIVV